MDAADTGIDRHIEEYFDRYVSETLQYVSQPSVSAYRQGMRECADLVAQLLRAHGAEVEAFETPGNPIIVGRMRGKSDRTLLFYNHYDVQPPEPLELWTSPPFEPEVRDGSIYGRGSKDDKGELVARLAAVDAVRAANGGELPCSVLFVVEGEEEIGSPTIRAFVEEHKDILRCHGSVWEEGGVNHDGFPNLLIGTRGMLVVELSVRTLSRDAHSGGGHAMPSAAWRLTWALGTLKDTEERVNIDGFYDGAMEPSARDLELIDREFARNPKVEQQMREIYGVREFAAGRSGVELLRSVFRPTCNIQGIWSGYHGPGVKTIVPGEAHAKIDFRLVPGQDPEDIVEKLRRHLDQHGYGDITLEILGWMRPSRTDPDDPFVQLMVRAGQEVYGSEPSIAPMNGGSSPMYAFQGPLGGIPIVWAGVGYWDNRTHAPDEHMRIEDFRNTMRYLARVVEGFAGI